MKDFKIYIINFLKNNNIHAITLSIIGIIFVAVWIFVIVFGLDQNAFGASLNGAITDHLGAGLEGVEIQIDGKKAYTDSSGNFKIPGIRYGINEIEFYKNGYAKKSEEIKLERFENFYSFSLQPLDFGEQVFSLKYDNLFIAEDFSVTVNDEPVEIDETISFSTGKLLIGVYQLKITSPHYVDIQKELTIKAGKYFEELEIVKASDVKIELVDWMSGHNMHLNLLNINVSSIGPISTSKVSEGLVLNDVVINSEVTASLLDNKSGSLKQDRFIIESTGVNDLRLEYIPDLQRIFVKDNSKIIVARVDGHDPVEILDSGGCRLLNHYTFSALVECASKFIYIDFQQDKYAVSEYPKSSGQNFFNTFKKTVYFLSSDNKSMYQLDVADPIFSSSEKILNVISTQDNIYISTEGGFTKFDVNTNQTQRLLEGKFIAYAWSLDEKQIFLVNTISPSLRHVWIYNPADNSKQRITQNALAINNISYINSNKLLLSTADNIYLFDLSENKMKQILEGVSEYTALFDQKYFFFKDASGYGVYNIESNYKTPTFKLE